MSIKGIDAQIMVARTAEFAKESDHQVRRDGLMQDYQAVQSKLASEAEKRVVVKTAKSETAALHADGHGARSGGGAGGRGREPKDAPEDALVFIPGEEHKIDIVI
jgi:hypothetical protein